MTFPKLCFDSPEWYEMMAEQFAKALESNPLPMGTSLSYLERYEGGAPLEDGSVRGIRVDICGDRMDFRIGVAEQEVAELMTIGDIGVIRQLLSFPIEAPEFLALVERCMTNGSFRVHGDMNDRTGWMAGLHNAIVERTA